MFRKRRIGVCGSSRGLSGNAVLCCQLIGERVANEKSVVVVSGGTKKRDGMGLSDFAAEWHMVQAAKKHIDASEIEDRIETYLGNDPGTSESFEEGRKFYPRGRTREARRFSFVRQLDGLIAIGGGRGTAQELALASELNVPILPLPFFPGAARDHWEAYRSELASSLDITLETAKALEDISPKDAGRVTVATRDLVERFLASLPWGCFVVMPFGEDFSDLYDQVIEPAIRAELDLPLRLDRAGWPGDVIDQIRHNLTTCDYAIVVLDGLKPNVLYELGLAHGANKPTVLLNRKDAFTTMSIPFDIAGQQRIEYEVIDAQLVARLRKAISVLRSSATRPTLAG